VIQDDDLAVDEEYQRGISTGFQEQLKAGVLAPILTRVKNDDTLSLEIRNGYVDIYYRGGRLLGLHPTSTEAGFRTEFDERYWGSEAKKEYQAARPASAPARTIKTADQAREWVDAFAHYKQAMDIRFSLHPKLEREYQQAVVRDNNRHATGDSSDYVVIDVEYAESPRAFPEQDADYRFDMVGFRWPAAGKSRATGLVTPVIMEMKAGDGALASPRVGGDPEKLSPGLVKHVRDIERFLTAEPGERLSKPYRLMCQELVRMFETKVNLGLPSIPKRMQELEITELSDRPEVLFVLANHQPASTILARELAKLPAHDRADYRIATVTYAGYALYADNVRPLDGFSA